MYPKKVLWIGLGLLLTIIGLVGALPILPGGFFLIPGLTILAREIPWVRRMLQKTKNLIRRRFPRLYGWTILCKDYFLSLREKFLEKFKKFWKKIRTKNPFS